MYSRRNPYNRRMQDRLDRARPAERRVGVGGLGKSVMKTLQSRERFGKEPIFDTLTVSESAEGMPAMKLEGIRKLWPEYPAIFGGRDEYSGELYYDRFLMPGEPFRLVASIEQLPFDIPDFADDRYRPAFEVSYVVEPLDPQSPSREFRSTVIATGRRRAFKAFEQNAINLVDNRKGLRASPSYSSGILTPEQYRKKLMGLIRDYEDGVESFDEPMPPEDYENMRALAEKLGFI